jgi:pyridoxine 5-phosphate synthase
MIAIGTSPFVEPRLGVNIDHIATLRQLRGTPYPDLLSAAKMAEKAGARQITVHLREDRRHIQDEDVRQLRAALQIPLNLEMSIQPEIVKFAVRIVPDWACLVPEKRREVTTEGGLDLKKGKKKAAAAIQALKKAGIQVSCFIEPSRGMVRAAASLGADAVEFHTGRYCLASRPASGSGARAKKQAKLELSRLAEAGEVARELGLRVHAGHGFDYENVRQVAALTDSDGKPLVEEYNIGHSIVCRAALVGLERAVREMVSAILAP